MSKMPTDFDTMYARRLAIAEEAGMVSSPLSVAEARQLLDACRDRQQRIAALESALRPFAAIWANTIQPSDPDDKIVYQHAFIEPLRVVDVRRALALLEGEP